MPNFGLSKPIIAEYNVETATYSNAFQFGKLVSTTVTPNVSTATLRADNQDAEQVDEFINAAVAVVIDTMPNSAATIMFGHKISEKEGEAGTEVSNANDTGKYVGYGFVVAEMQNGKKQYRACVLHKVKFKEDAENYSTKGETITFNTPGVSGTASQDKNGDWRTKSPYFDTEDAAYSWAKTFLNFAEEAAAAQVDDAQG